MDRKALATLTADIVAAHVANNQVAIDDVADLVASVHGALAGLDAPDAIARPEKKKGKVSIRASLMPDHLICLECGRKQTLLKRHLAAAHGLTPDQYRSDYRLPMTYPMVAPDSSERRRALAQAIDLGRKPKGTKGKTGSRRPRSAKPKSARAGG